MLKFELKTLEQGMNLFQVNKKHQNHVKIPLLLYLILNILRTLF